MKRVRDAQYVYALEHFNESKSKALQLLKEPKLPLYMQMRLFILLLNISDDWQEREELRQQAGSLYWSIRAIYREGMFDEIDQHLTWNVEDIKQMADIQAETNDALADSIISVTASSWSCIEEGV